MRAVTEGQSAPPAYFAFAVHANKQAHELLDDHEPPRVVSLEAAVALNQASAASTTIKPRSTGTAPAANANVGTVLEPAEEGIYVLDVATGSMRKADSNGAFDVVGNALFVAHGNTIQQAPVAGGAFTPTMTVAGATPLNWFEMSPHGAVLTQWTQPATSTSYALTRALVDAKGNVVTNQLLGEQTEWSPDGAYFVNYDYQGIHAINADNTVRWDPSSRRISFRVT